MTCDYAAKTGAQLLVMQQKYRGKAGAQAHPEAKVNPLTSPTPQQQVSSLRVLAPANLEVLEGAE